MLKELIIKIDNHGVHLSPQLFITIQHTNIPIEYCKFRSHVDIFWKVELLHYNSDTKCWKMKVIDYFANDIGNFEKQKSTKEVERITFEKLDWLKFERHLSSYQEIKLHNILYNHDADRFSKEELTRMISPVEKQAQNNKTIFDLIKREPLIKTHDVEFFVYFSDAYFIPGYVTFSKNIKGVNAKIDFKIKNDYILAEFENIKSWFVKKLKTKKIKVNAIITTTDGKVTEVVATSPQIKMIDAVLIDSIKYQRTISLTKPPKVSKIDKSLYTAEEIFGEMETENIEKNVFNQNEQDIFNFVLSHNNTRNRKQLKYLSESKQSEKSKLRFTLHPNFGFLFFIEGKEKNHFVWELLNSHATYIWSIDKFEKEIESQYKRIEDSINTIRNCGREQYKRAYRENHHDNDLVFHVIDHDNITSDIVDGFVIWQHKLNEKTT